MAEIGSIRPTRRSITPGNPSVVPEAFGSGIARALSNLQGTMQTRALVGQGEEEAATTLDLAYKARQQKLDRARLEVDFIKLTGMLGRGVTEAYDAAEPGAPGFTDSVNTNINDAYQQFLQAVPENLKPDFVGRVATATDSFVTQAFALQTDGENSEFRRNVLLLQEDATNLLMSTTGDLDQAEAELLGNLDQLFINSPLSTTETRNLRESATVSLRAMKLSREALNDAQGLSTNGGQVPGVLRTEGAVVKSSRPVAAGLSPVAVGVLEAIAGPESGGEYNVMFSPNGRRYFQDFSQHPNDPIGIPDGPHAGKNSSAAGRYMNIKSTWDEVAGDLGLNDFSPESQDQGNWYLAQKRYKQLTGRDLEAALSTGDPATIIAAKRVLEETWEGLKGQSDQTFVNSILNATGNPSSLIDDPEYAMVPYAQRIAIIGDAQAQAAAVQGQLAAVEKAKFDSAFDQLSKQIAAGDAGEAHIQNFASIFPQASLDDLEKLRETHEKYNGTVVAASDFLTKAGDPNYPFDPAKAEDREGQEAFFQVAKLREELAAKNETFVDTVLLPTVQQSRIMTPGLTQELNALSLSQNTETATFALNTMNKLRAANASEFERAFGKDVHETVAAFNAARGNIPQEQLIQFLRNAQDPAMRQITELRRTQLSEVIKKNARDFTPEGVISAMDLTNPPLGLEGGAFMQEYLPTYNYMYSMLGDHSAAKKAATEVMATRWGEFEVLGTPQTMRYPPSITAAPFEGSLDYVNEQLRHDFGLTDDSNIALISDAKTEFEHLNGLGASYTVMLFDEEGLPQRPVTFRDLPGFDARTEKHLANTIVRFTPKITEQMRLDQITTVQIKSELKQLNLWPNPLGGVIASPEDKKRYDELRGQLSRTNRTPHTDPTFLKPVISGLKPMTGDSKLAAIISDLTNFKAESPQAMRNKLESVRDGIGLYSPAFQRWEVIRRINELLRELPK